MLYLTPDYGLDYVRKCTGKGFHPHPSSPAIFEVGDVKAHLYSVLLSTRNFAESVYKNSQHSEPSFIHGSKFARNCSRTTGPVIFNLTEKLLVRKKLYQSELN